MEPIAQLPPAAAAATTDAPQAAIGRKRTFFVFITGADAGDQESVCFCTEERDWTNLPTELVFMVAKFALRSDVTDYIRLRAVCKPWRSAAEADPKLMKWNPRFFPRNWNVVPGNARRREEIRFVNFHTGASIRLQIPREYGEVVASAEGCLVLASDRGCEQKMRLFNPVTGAVADLPGIPCGAKIHAAGLVYDGEDDADLTVVLCASDRWKSIVYAKPDSGDNEWSVVGDDEDPELVPYSDGGLSVRGKFYVPTPTGDVRRLELSSPEPQLVYVARQEARHRWPYSIIGFGAVSVDSRLEPNPADADGGMMLLRYNIFKVEVFWVSLADGGSLTLVEDVGSCLLPWLTIGRKSSDDLIYQLLSQKRWGRCCV